MHFAAVAGGEGINAGAAGESVSVNELDPVAIDGQSHIAQGGNEIRPIGTARN